MPECPIRRWSDLAARAIIRLDTSDYPLGYERLSTWIEEVIMQTNINHSQFSCANGDASNPRCAMPGWRRWIVAVATAPLFALGAFAQEGHTDRVAEPQVSGRTPQAGHVFVPESSKDKSSGFAHTTYVLRSADGNKPAALKTANPEGVAGTDGTSQLAETPASMGC